MQGGNGPVKARQMEFDTGMPSSTKVGYGAAKGKQFD
jgi:hypothetical protein